MVRTLTGVRLLTVAVRAPPLDQGDLAEGVALPGWTPGAAFPIRASATILARGPSARGDDMAPTLTERDVIAMMDRLSNWGRWGAEDELGTINLITPEKRRRAAALVADGHSVTCARPIGTDITADTTFQPLRFMVDSGEGRDTAPPERVLQRRGASEFIGMVFHGYTITHVDTPAHYFWQGKIYNGRSCNLITSREGAQVESVDLLRDGVVSRGVLLDVAAVRGRWLGAGEGVMPEDLESAERAQGVRVEPGDILLIRTGYYARRLAEGPRNPTRTARRRLTWPACRGSASAASPCSAPTRTTTSAPSPTPASATPSTWSGWWPWGSGSSTTRTSSRWPRPAPRAGGGSSC